MVPAVDELRLWGFVPIVLWLVRDQPGGIFRWVAVSPCDHE